jgi:hypothetical protein
MNRLIVLNRWVLFLVLLGSATQVFANVIGPVAENFVLDGSTHEWRNRPANMTLTSKGAGARTGRVWLAQFPQGLVLAGSVNGPAPRFAQSLSEMPNGDHVEVWIAISENVPLPPIGWHDRFGPHQLNEASDCDVSAIEGDYCRAWFAEQVRHRRRFPRLFVRQWQLAPGVAVETYAKPAFEAITESLERLHRGNIEQAVDEALQILLPQQLPEARFAKPSGEGYSFEVMVPWKALPPSDRLTIDRLLLLVEVFLPGEVGRYGSFSTSSEARQYGRVDTMNRVALTPQRRWRLARCGYTLESYDFWGWQALYVELVPEFWNQLNPKPSKLPSYFMPNGNEQIDDIFVLDNQYIDFHTAPTGLSPVINPTKLFSLELAPGVFACGPELAVRRGEALTLSAVGIVPESRAQEVPGGWLLALGPYKEVAGIAGEGHCGACEEMRLNMIFIPVGDRPSVSAFRARGLECGCCSVGYCIDDITLADDFRTINIMEGNDFYDSNTTLRRLCFKTSTHEFVECGQPTEEISPPNEGYQGYHEDSSAHIR